MASEAERVMLAQGSVPLAIIEEWFLGETGDPLAIPFALFLERFSVRGIDDDPELFEDEDRKFRLSHVAPVQPPMETAASLDSSFLRRSQIRTVRDLFNWCWSNRHFAISHAEASQIVGSAIAAEFWIGKLRQALEEMETLREDGARLNLSIFLKKICPRASARHVRMFQTWLKELDQLEDLRKQLHSGRRQGVRNKINQVRRAWELS